MLERDCLSLADLPLAWLHRFSSVLTTEAASRLRSTCRLLQKVIDATWEPVEVPVAPHRRSVPLTFQQVKAQLPPHKPWPEEWLDGPEDLARRQEQRAWIDEFAAAAAATLDPLIAAAIAADSGQPAEEGVGPTSSSSADIASAAAAPGQHAGFWSEVSPRFSVLDCLPTRPGNRYTFDASACDSAQLQQIAERFRPLVQAEGSSSAGSVGDYIRHLLAPRYSSSEEGHSFGSRWGGTWWDSPEEDEDLEPVYEDGCDTYWRDVFGPALTRLTANQAINMLQGKPMLVFGDAWCSELTNSSTVRERMEALRVLTFEDLRVHWPPKQEEIEGESESDFWAHFNVYEEVHIYGRVEAPVEVREERAREQRYDPSYHMHLTVEHSSLLVTTNTRCKQANRWQYEQFKLDAASGTASTADRFDMYLANPLQCGPVDVYVFLAPCVRRHTGRPNSATQVQA